MDIELEAFSSFKTKQDKFVADEFDGPPSAMPNGRE